MDKARAKLISRGANEETTELRKRLEDAESQLREEAKLIDRLTRENQSKTEQITAMEAAMQRESEKQRAYMEIQKEEAQSDRASSQYKIKVRQPRGSVM